MALFDNPPQDSGSGLFKIGVDETAKAYMLETARWTKFLAVVGFVLIAVIGVAGVFVAFMMTSYYSGRFGAGMQGAILAAYLLIAIVYFFPTYYLYKFSTLIKPAMLSENQDGFNRALQHLRNAFRFIGILTLIVLCLYALVFIVSISGGIYSRYFG